MPLTSPLLLLIMKAKSVTMNGLTGAESERPDIPRHSVRGSRRLNNPRLRQIGIGPVGVEPIGQVVLVAASLQSQSIPV